MVALWREIALFRVQFATQKPQQKKPAKVLSFSPTVAGTA
jgi:hypothetical protein